MDDISVKLSNAEKSQEINYFPKRQREQIVCESGEMIRVLEFAEKVVLHHAVSPNEYKGHVFAVRK